MSIRIGIATYAQVDSRGRPISPHWALVAHPTSFRGDDVAVFQIIRSVTDHRVWLTRHKEGCRQLDASSLIEVIDLGVVNLNLSNLAAFVNRFSTYKDNDNPSENILWGCAGWVIRILHYLHSNGCYRLSCPSNQVYDRVCAKVQALKSMGPASGSPNTIPF